MDGWRERYGTIAVLPELPPLLHLRRQVQMDDLPAGPPRADHRRIEGMLAAADDVYGLALDFFRQVFHPLGSVSSAGGKEIE